MTSKPPATGDHVKLRKDALPDVKVREWIVLGNDNDRVILISFKPKGHTLEVVNKDDIDQEDYGRIGNAFDFNPYLLR